MKQGITRKDYLNHILNDAYFQTGFDGIIEILKLYAALPCSNACVERGFSAMNRIKSLPRNKMSTDKPNFLMHISLNGQDIDKWNPDYYIEYWIKTNNIRNLNSSHS